MAIVLAALKVSMLSSNPGQGKPAKNVSSNAFLISRNLLKSGNS